MRGSPQPKQGDYNNNGIVDAADYVVWRKTLGQEVLNAGDGADGDESGFIDQGDYDFWRARFGLITKGGEIIMTGSSTLTTNGAVIGRRSKGDFRWARWPSSTLRARSTIFRNEVRRKDLEVGAYGPAYIASTTRAGSGSRRAGHRRGHGQRELADNQCVRRERRSSCSPRWSGEPERRPGAVTLRYTILSQRLRIGRQSAAPDVLEVVDHRVRRNL